MSTTPFWKKINQTVSGYTKNITNDVVSEILSLSKTELVDGFLNYKPYVKSSYEEWLKKATVTPYMQDFVHDLAQDFNLECNITYAIICNYLMFEYYGKIKEFWQMTSIGTTVRLKESIYNFYVAERMFLLKTLRHVFENVSDSTNEFQEEYDEFIKSLTFEELQENLIKVLNLLVDERGYDISTREIIVFFNPCINIREQIELLLVLTLTIEHSNLTPKQFEQLGRLLIQPPFNIDNANEKKMVTAEDLKQLNNAKIGCFLVILKKCWENTNFWNEPLMRELDLSVIHNIHSNRDQCIIVFSWLIFKLKSLDTVQEDGDMIADLLNLNPIEYLNNVLKSAIFQNCHVGKLVLRASHTILDEFTLRYSYRQKLYEQAGLLPVVAQLMQVSDLIKISSLQRDGLDSVIGIAINTFPYDFFGYTGIAHSILGNKEHYKEAINFLNALPCYLSDVDWEAPHDEVYELNKDSVIFEHNTLIVFPPKTVMRSYHIFGRNLLQYSGRYSYFNYLQAITDLLNESGPKADPDIVKKMLAGYAVVIQVIKCCTDMDLKVLKIDEVIKRMDNLLFYIKANRHLELAKLYFGVYNALLIHRNATWLSYLPEMVWTVFFPKMKVDYFEKNLITLLNNQYLFDDCVFIKLFRQEEAKHRYSVLITYIETLYQIIKSRHHSRTFQMSGVLYVLNFVFFQHQSWKYDDEKERSQITLGCLNIFHYILQLHRDHSSEHEKKLFQLCQYAFLNNAHTIEAFLRLFVKEKYHLIFLMERESNWFKGPSLTIFKSIRIQLALLLLIMKLKKEGKVRCVFDEKIKVVVKPVASYFTNAYSPVIAELSCRFLEKLAEDSQFPLLALLELDHYQVQALFLERLRDPLEEDSVKIAIIDLINVCISDQNGMTAAFFNLKCFMYWDGADSDVFSGDTVSDFMIDYMQNIKTSHEYFKSPLQLGILRLLHTLWQKHHENLIDNIVELKDFWPVMMDPFFFEFVQDVQVYILILKIINLEISADPSKIDKHLKNYVEKFVRDKKQLKAWMKFIFVTIHSNNANLSELLNAWTEFLTVTQKYLEDCYDNEAKASVTLMCLDGLNSPSSSVSLEVITFWCKQYLTLISHWNIYEGREKSIIDQLCDFFQTLLIYYKCLTQPVKLLILSIINATINDLKAYLSIDTMALIKFLKPVGTIVDIEYEYLTDQLRVMKDKEKIILLKPWMSIIFIGNILLTEFNAKDLATWFQYRQLMPRVLNSIPSMISHRLSLPFAKMAMGFLISYAESALVEDFLSVDLLSLYYFIFRPPPLDFSLVEVLTNGICPEVREWWLLFVTLLRLNSRLICKLKEPMLDIACVFISHHDQTLRKFISLTKDTVDMSALCLVCETLKFMYHFMILKPYWAVQNSHSSNLLLIGVKTTINACILSILGSKKIIFYDITSVKSVSAVHSPPNEWLVPVINKLIEVIYWASMYLIRIKSDVVQVLNGEDNIEKEDTIVCLVNNDFSVPRFELPHSNLTYGMLFCLAHYLCKALNQLQDKEAVVDREPADFYDKYIAFMIYLQKSEDMPEKLSSFLHYDISEFSGSSSSMVSQLNHRLVKDALDGLMTFLSVEILCNFKYFDENSIFQYKRELCSELQFFYEFVRKRTLEQYNALKTPLPITYPKTDTDIINRFMVARADPSCIADNHFELTVTHLLAKICELSN